jgi:hypothetical protein
MGKRNRRSRLRIRSPRHSAGLAKKQKLNLGRAVRAKKIRRKTRRTMVAKEKCKKRKVSTFLFEEKKKRNKSD